MNGVIAYYCATSEWQTTFLKGCIRLPVVIDVIEMVEIMLQF